MDQTRTIWLCGDVHGDIRHLQRAIDHARNLPRAVIFLGDLDPQQPAHEWLAFLSRLGIKTWFIHGNHETDSEEYFQNTFSPDASALNFDGRIVNVEGIKIAGLGGIFREKVWYPPSPPRFDSFEQLCSYHSDRMPPAHNNDRPDSSSVQGASFVDRRLRNHKTSIFPKIYHQLADLSADVLIAHEAPSCHPHGFPAIDLLAQVMGVSLVAHGHHHDALDYSGVQKRLGFHAIGVGLRGITSLDGSIIVPGELDSVRSSRASPNHRVID